MTADTQAQGDLVALARESGATNLVPFRDDLVVFDRSALEAFAAALQGRGTQEGEPSDERAAFERHIQATEERKPLLWSTAFKNSVSGEQVPAHLVGKYFMQADQKAWTAWQARAALAQAQKERT